MTNRLPAVLIGLAIVLLLIYSSVFVINQRQQAVVVRFGQIKAVYSEPGLYFKMPFAFAGADKVQIISDQSLRFDLDNIRVQVSGGKFYEVDAFLIYKITDARRFIGIVSGGDRDLAEARLRTRLDASLRRVYGLRGFEAALSDARSQMMQEVADDLKSDAENLGITIEDVRIRRTDLTQEISQQTYARMRSERLAEAELIRARGNEEGQRRRAIADRQVVELQADAQRDSEILRGQGDAERNRVFADAYQRDPSFFEFYRSMAAYEASLGTTGTSMVLSPNSEFFKFFRSQAGTGATTPPAPAAN
ncbi:protease modulator HflC [Agrobacterium vitis]|uniref:Protein HflC n=1 Tax=Agrobacterium vitis TaxID=373 RepID=A0A6I4G312_AGRVI|nr:protease modulator HflC [Agrobacterium vitis]MCF1454814.1 protease modulator HflC [Agrobacterium vitis]MVA55413.1 protease modulator HflC [Agrobacterium vitis]MVA79738.1 protease modulator HflC [Agrobacterium vitis]BCH54750.1 protein HflC [Agrobacterium vitis]